MSLVISTIPLYTVGLLVIIAIGFGETIRWGLGQALVMEQTADEYRARMMSLYLMTYGVMPFAVLPLGFAIEYYGAANSLLAMSLILLVFSSLFIIFGSRLRGLK